MTGGPWRLRWLEFLLGFGDRRPMVIAVAVVAGEFKWLLVRGDCGGCGCWVRCVPGAIAVIAIARGQGE